MTTNFFWIGYHFEELRSQVAIFALLQQDSLAWQYICNVAGRFGQNISLSKWDGRIINFGANPQQKL